MGPAVAWSRWRPAARPAWLVSVWPRCQLHRTCATAPRRTSDRISIRLCANTCRIPISGIRQWFSVEATALRLQEYKKIQRLRKYRLLVQVRWTLGSEIRFAILDDRFLDLFPLIVNKFTTIVLLSLYFPEEFKSRILFQTRLPSYFFALVYDRCSRKIVSDFCRIL